jgi:hypothetical protein
VGGGRQCVVTSITWFGIRSMREDFRCVRCH